MWSTEELHDKTSTREWNMKLETHHPFSQETNMLCAWLFLQKEIIQLIEENILFNIDLYE